MSGTTLSGNPPSSISRNKASASTYLFMPEDQGFSSILGKRKSDWGLSNGADSQASAKRQNATTQPQAEGLSEENEVNSRSTSPSSSASELDLVKPIEHNGTASGSGSGQDSFLHNPGPRNKQATHSHPYPTPCLSRSQHDEARRVQRRHSFPSLDAKDNEPAVDIQCCGDTGWPPVRRQGERRRDFPVVYRISCTKNDKKLRHHESLLFEDDPLTSVFPDGRQSTHLSGIKPIYQLRDFVRNFQQSSFVIIKNRICKGQTDLDPTQGGRDESMLIVNDGLKQAIQKAATCPLDTQSEDADERSLEMPAPYRFLYYHRESLQVYSRSTAASLQDMIQAVLQYVDTNYGYEFAEAEELLSQGKTTRYHLDKLYRPNQLVTSGVPSTKGLLEVTPVYVVKDWLSRTGNQLKLAVWSWTFKPFALARSEVTFGFRCPGENENEPFPTKSLQFGPGSLLSQDSIEYLRKRGKQFWNLCQPSFVYYCNDENIALRCSNVRPGRYMIDAEVHSRLHSSHGYYAKKEPNKQLDPWKTELRLHDELSEDDFLIMPLEIPGYDLLEKEWVDLRVPNIRNVQWNKQPFEDLVLSEDTKHLVRAMVTLRASSIKTRREKERLQANFDIIPGKGNGLIMLFHGSPGTGKTLTAESVAEIAEMPLYPITCGDIGTEPEKVESYLRLVFELGKRWNCVLLLDEADVFLEERTLTDLQRNSLVSVFLRMIEYYEGILILTSNRVGTFDDAFRSRINIALHYEDLKPRARRQIWSNFLSRMEGTEEDENIDEIKKRLDELAKHQLNGREIRNAVSTARQMASYEGEKMSWHHLKLAIKTANDFGTYLEKFHGHSNREWLRETGVR